MLEITNLRDGAVLDRNFGTETEDHLEINYIKSIFNSYGAVGYQMTGSGSAVFAIMKDFEFAAVACNMLKDNYPGIFIAKPV